MIKRKFCFFFYFSSRNHVYVCICANVKRQKVYNGFLYGSRDEVSGAAPRKGRRREEMSRMSNAELKPIHKGASIITKYQRRRATIKSSATARPTVPLSVSPMRVAESAYLSFCTLCTLGLGSSLPIHPLRFDRGPCTHNMCRRVAWIIRRLCASYYAFPVLIGVHYATTKVNEFAVFCCRVYVLGTASHKANRWNLAFPFGTMFSAVGHLQGSLVYGHTRALLRISVCDRALVYIPDCEKSFFLLGVRSTFFNCTTFYTVYFVRQRYSHDRTVTFNQTL